MSHAADAPEPGVASLEIERKYEASPGVPLPRDFSAAGLVAEAPVMHRLVARYFDTATGELARRGIALRSRAGGKDAGWHLKQRGADGVRELLWPPAEAMPDGLRAELRERIGAAADAVREIAELRTERSVVVLRDASGAARVELADDSVRARSFAEGDAPVSRAWREWEAELLAGDARILDLVEPVLLAAGATHSLSFAKIARATGQLGAAARAAGAGAETLAALAALDRADRAAGTVGTAGAGSTGAAAAGAGAADAGS
ncbi:CYTH domain-containing protein [Leucobacter allii]|uniref:CYTH domain-containing protein n=1 Tax=Leucobacter allii TaxID=2932247 RepID=UPI001FD1A1F2|nr:CYTH domain-containing protein [Leucobacter allii]UOR00838.1 CYTH domain-containing protein [Leucobacter allii]